MKRYRKASMGISPEVHRKPNLQPFFLQGDSVYGANTISRLSCTFGSKWVVYHVIFCRCAMNKDGAYLYIQIYVSSASILGY